MARLGERASDTLVLASASSARRVMLERAGLLFQVIPAFVDEDEIKQTMVRDAADAAAIAAALAEAKARRVSDQHPGSLVIGADQVLHCDGEMMHKSRDRGQARSQLVALRGRWHELVSSVCVVQNGVRQWHHLEHARLLMRGFSDEFLDAYLKKIGNDALTGPGAYQIEGEGAQLFERVEGDHFTILGLPLLPVLDYLRSRQVLTS